MCTLTLISLLEGTLEVQNKKNAYYQNHYYSSQLFIFSSKKSTLLGVSDILPQGKLQSLPNMCK